MLIPKTDILAHEQISGQDLFTGAYILNIMNGKESLTESEALKMINYLSMALMVAENDKCGTSKESDRPDIPQA